MRAHPYALSTVYSTTLLPEITHLHPVHSLRSFLYRAQPAFSPSYRGRCDGNVLLGIDLQKVVYHDQQHAERAEEYSQRIEFVIGDHFGSFVEIEEVGRRVVWIDERADRRGVNVERGVCRDNLSLN